MSSREPKQPQSLRKLIEDPDLQRRAHGWAERLVRRYQLAPMTGEDLFQEAMKKLVRYANSEKPREIDKPQAFLFTVLRNQARTVWEEHTHSSKRISESNTVEYDEVSSQKLSDHFDMVQRIESAILLDEAFRSLDKKQDQLLFLCILKGYTMRQIGVELGISHVTASYRVKQLVVKIRKSLL